MDPFRASLADVLMHTSSKPGQRLRPQSHLVSTITPTSLPMDPKEESHDLNRRSALLDAAYERLSRCSCAASSTPLEHLLACEAPSSTTPTYPFGPGFTSVAPSLSLELPPPAALSSGSILVDGPASDPTIAAPPSIEAFLLPPSPWNTGRPPLADRTFYSSSVPMQETPPNTFDVCPSSWPLNMPPPAVLFHLVDIFFSSVPLASRLLHKPTFMAALRQVPTSPEFPHVALLHAICGLASIYSPIITDTREQPETDHSHLHTSGSFNSAIVFRPYAEEGVQGEYYFPKRLEDIMDVGEEGFGAAHIRWAAASLRLSVRDGDRLLQLLQATIVCLYMDGNSDPICWTDWQTAEGMAGPMSSDNCPTKSEDFQHLDQTIAAFVEEMPRPFRDPVGTTVDPILYMAHLLPHVAMIQLHDPHAKIDSPNDHSAAQMLAAARATLELIYKICATTYDLLYMDHGVSFCWFVAGAAIIRFLKAKTNAKDEEEVARLEQELGVIKFMLRNLGERTIIGRKH
ncbi:hypothetical protein FRB90_004492 [Tulasnella sp. 427]|nr:hypothetical protein FRB90_004492 [Tulasnella sp. 427]